MHEWQHVARDLGAWDCATDRDDTDPEWTDWAERVHGARARELIVAFDSIQAYRTANQQVPGGGQ